MEVSDPVSDFVWRLREHHGAKLLRYGAASAFNVVVSQALLYGAQTVLGWSAVPSNVTAVMIGTIPAYLIARYWVWQKRGKNHLMREVVPFWALTLTGFALSTLAVWFVEQQWDPHPLIINLTSLTAYGFVWVAKFVILDRLLFVDEQLTDVTGPR
jgi:putative flippase GtrA